ncbi:MAG TPA: alpha/beta fold hydrolase [Gemmatimonadaceae bacterium]|jgi:carboxylesterase|nr:alpha/beta fold hydrolase [Gemmatimonadaceae bacterium]
MAFVALAAVVALVLMVRLSRRRAWSAVQSRHRVGPDGVIVGAAGYELARPDAPAVLVFHGAGDTPQTVRYLSEELYARGFHVVAPLLPGHGRTIREFSQVTADALTNAAFESYSALRDRHEWVGIVGVSMGGALAVQVAAATPGLPALGLVAPYLAMRPHATRLARTSRLWGVLVPAFASSEGFSIRDPDERKKSLAYGAFTAGALRALYATVQRAVLALPRVVAPTLVIQSREDNRIGIEDAERSFAQLGAREKRLEWVTGAAHVITVDYGRERVIELLASWMEGKLVSR